MAEADDADFEDDPFADDDWNDDDDDYDYDGWDDLHIPDQKQKVISNIVSCGSSSSIDSINNICYESLISAYLRKIHTDDYITPLSIINLCFIFYFEPEAWAKIDIFIDKKIDELTDLLNLTDNSSLSLLLTHKWDFNDISDEYFIRGGIVDNENNPKHQQNRPSTSRGTCQSCVEPKDDLFALDCGHKMLCKKCWIQYLHTNLDSNKCLLLTCPKDNCHVVIPKVAWKKFFAKMYPLSYQRYTHYLRQHCIKYNKNTFKHCTNDECHMVYFSLYTIVNNVRMKCSKCLTEFCWGCKGPPHDPASCDMTEKWINLCSSQKEHTLSMTKQRNECPKCKKHIEKNQGCNHVTCRKHAGGCGHEFCWLCKGDWRTHSHRSYYQCNKYISNQYDSVEEDQFNRFVFHYNRFDSHCKSSKHAMKQKEMTHEKQHELASKYQWKLIETQFILDAVNETIECWHILAWTYPIAFYLNDKKVNIPLFEQHQAFLEKFCDGLQHFLDFDLEKLGDIKTKNEIIGYTRTAQQYRKNLCEHIHTEIPS